MTTKIIEAWSGPGKKDGKIYKFKPEYDTLHIDMKKRGNSEWWYFDTRFNNGYMAVGFFRAKHERTGKTGVEITFYDPQGKKIQKIYNYKHSDLIVSKEKADVKIGNNYIKANYTNESLPTYEIYLEEGQYGIHLVYKANVEGWMPGKGYTEFGMIGHFGWCVAIPRAQVEGTIKIDGKEIHVKGTGYHDHNWLNFNMVRVVEYWHWGRIFSEDFTIIYAYIKCNKKLDNYPIRVLMVAKGEKVILSTGEFELKENNFKYHKKVNNKYPSKLVFNISEQNKFSLNVQKLVDADNLLFELNPIIRFFVKNLLKLRPGYFRFNSEFQIDYLYEEKQFIEKGNTLHEMVIVK